MPTLCKYNHTKIYIFFGYATLVAKKIGCFVSEGGLYGFDECIQSP